MKGDRPDSLDAALSRLYLRNMHAVKLGLQAVEALLDELGNPQESFVTIHVAGTNGKGSVCAMLDSILRAAGYRTGLYTSPHLIRFNERIKVNGREIDDGEIQELMQAVEVAAERVVASGKARDATFFEFTTALAFAYFKQSRVQVAVVETGMGGRLDATNVVLPALSVVTTIDLDHMAYLGDTVGKIAAEKAGIIKPGRPVICGNLNPEALKVVREVAAARQAPFTLASEAVNVWRKSETFAGQRVKVESQDHHYGPLNLPLLGTHQLANCAVAVAAIETLRDDLGLPVSEEAVTKGLSAVEWPARFQIIATDPPIIIDGGHNPQAAQALIRTLHDLAEGRGIGLVVSFLSDKDCRGFMREFAGKIRRCWVVPLATERGMAMDEMVAAVHAAGIEPLPSSLQNALKEAQAWAAAQNGLVCITGSLYLAGAALQGLKG